MARVPEHSETRPPDTGRCQHDPCTCQRGRACGDQVAFEHEGYVWELTTAGRRLREQLRQAKAARRSAVHS